MNTNNINWQRQFEALAEITLAILDERVKYVNVRNAENMIDNLDHTDCLHYAIDIFARMRRKLDGEDA